MSQNFDFVYVHRHNKKKTRGLARYPNSVFSVFSYITNRISNRSITSVSTDRTVAIKHAVGIYIQCIRYFKFKI